MFCAGNEFQNYISKFRGGEARRSSDSVGKTSSGTVNSAGTTREFNSRQAKALRVDRNGDFFKFPRRGKF